MHELDEEDNGIEFVFRCESGFVSLRQYGAASPRLAGSSPLLAIRMLPHVSAFGSKDM